MKTREVIVMNEENPYKYKEDVEKKISFLIEGMNKIRENAPHFSLEIDKAVFILPTLFNADGTPKGNFIVSEKTQRRAFFALKKTNKTSLGKIPFSK